MKKANYEAPELFELSSVLMVRGDEEEGSFPGGEPKPGEDPEEPSDD